MTYTESKQLPLGVNDDIKTYDDGKDGHPEKWAAGKVIASGSEGFTVQWDDLKWETDYEWSKVTIEGNQLYENKKRNQHPKEKGLELKQFTDLKVLIANFGRSELNSKLQEVADELLSPTAPLPIEDAEIEKMAHSYADKNAINGVDAKFVRRDFTAGYKAASLSIQNENSNTCIALLDWVATFETPNTEDTVPDKLTLCDGDYYWGSDSEGYQPLSPKDVFELFKAHGLPSIQPAIEEGSSKEEIIKILSDFSIQDPSSESWEQRIIRDNDFDNIAQIIIQQSTKGETK